MTTGLRHSLSVQGADQQATQPVSRPSPCRLKIVGKRRSRDAIAFAFVNVANASALLALCLIARTAEILPWCLTLAAGSLWLSIASFARQPTWHLASIAASDEQPISFLESLASSYVVTALIVVALIAAHASQKPTRIAPVQHVVDIELTGLRDPHDFKRLLSGTTDKPTVRKRSAPSVVTLAGSLAPVAIASADKHGENSKSQSQQKSITTNNRLLSPTAGVAPKGAVPSLLKPSAPSPDRRLFVQPPEVTPSGNDRRQRLETRKALALERQNSFFMEEVKPQELVELVDNEGDQSQNIAQPGGNSSGGAGAHSTLSEYLKDLNRKIKRAWTPPGGQSRRLEIVFRLSSGGQLISIKVLRSSGDSAVDSSAVQSVIKAGPYKPLPSEYRWELLDVRYTFNYNVDELEPIDIQPAPAD